MFNEEPPLKIKWWLGSRRQKYAWVPPTKLFDQTNEKKEKHLEIEDTNDNSLKK